MGDFVWAVLTKDQFFVGDYDKLSAKKIGPIEVIEKINPSHIQTVDIFNVKHLIPYVGDSSSGDDDAGNSRQIFFTLGGMM